MSSYYGQPVLKQPVWAPDIPAYLFTGGLAGGSAMLAAAARRRGNDTLARRALLTSSAAVSVSPALLIHDLGRPSRFYNMLRVVKPTSPMSVGTWILTASGALAGVAALCEVSGAWPRLRDAAELAAAAMGPGLSTYTAVLLADTAVPVWHEAQRELPFVFAGSAAASAGAAALLLTPSEHAGAARRFCVGGAALTLGATGVMRSRLGWLGEPYRTDIAGRSMRAATALVTTGTVAVAVSGGRRAAARVGGAAVLLGTLCERWAVFAAGRQSAGDPRYTVAPQRRRLETASQTG